MTKRNKKWNKKLTELEAELLFFLTLDPSEKQLVSEEIEKRLVFMNNFLSAEIASSSSSSKPHHLHHIAQRLEEMITAFREQNEISSRNEDDNEGLQFHDDLDRNLVYDDEVGEDQGLRFPEGLVDVNVEQDTVKKVEMDEEEDMAMKQDIKGKSSLLCNNCGGMMISGMIFGGVSVIMLRFFSGCFYHYYGVHDESFLIPT